MSATESTSELGLENKDFLRFNILYFFVFFLFSALTLAFFKVQIIENEKWSKIAKSQHKMAVEEPAKRGAFYGCSLCPTNPKEPIPLVTDLNRYHLHLDPFLIPVQFHKDFAEQLSELLGNKAEDILKELKKKSRSRRLICFLNRLQKDQLQKWYDTFIQGKKISKKGIFFIKDYKRYYPFGTSFGQLLHTYRYDTKQSIGYPTGGLELFFNPVLKGEKGKKILLRSQRQKIDLDEVVEPAKDGYDIFLTVDPVVQAIVEDELRKGVEFAQAKGGSCVVMDCSNGKIMAIASCPYFDPSHVEDYFNDPQKLDATRLSPAQDAFEPGSIMKPISVVIALLANQELSKQQKPPIFSLQEMLDVSNTTFSGRSKPIKDVKQHKFLNTRLALQKSSNVYVARLVEKVCKQLGESWYRDMLADLFLFGKKTGIEIPSEHPGMLPEIGKKYQSGLLQWSQPTPYSLSMGYNVQCNQIQILRAFAAIVNGGILVKPTLIQKIAKGDKILFEEKSNQTRTLPINLYDLQEVKKSLQFTTQKGGTGVLGNIRGYTEGGKSGTTEKLVNGAYCNTKHYASFIGFAPYEQTRFVMIVGIDEPKYQVIPGFGFNHYGGKCAAKVFSKVGEKLLPYLGVAPDDPFDNKLKYEVDQLVELYDAWNSR